VTRIADINEQKCVSIFADRNITDYEINKSPFIALELIKCDVTTLPILTTRLNGHDNGSRAIGFQVQCAAKTGSELEWSNSTSHKKTGTRLSEILSMEHTVTMQ